MFAAKPLPRSFYSCDAATLAPRLLGKILIAGSAAALITETEAYLGSADPASHAFKGTTKRNQTMFEAGGACYVYLIYGVNVCMNVVAGKRGDGQAVLLRAAQPLAGLPLMARRRGVDLDGSDRSLRSLLSGPGKLCKALGITLADDGGDFFGGRMRIVSMGHTPEIAVGPRIGISKAVDAPLRFTIIGSPWLSRK